MLAALEDLDQDTEGPQHLFARMDACRVSGRGAEHQAIMKEEIFGPLLPVVPYRGVDEAFRYVNDRPRPPFGALADLVAAGFRRYSSRRITMAGLAFMAPEDAVRLTIPQDADRHEPDRHAPLPFSRRLPR